MVCVNFVSPANRENESFSMQELAPIDGPESSSRPSDGRNLVIHLMDWHVLSVFVIRQSRRIMWIVIGGSESSSMSSDGRDAMIHLKD